VESQQFSQQQEATLSKKISILKYGSFSTIFRISIKLQLLIYFKICGFILFNILTCVDEGQILNQPNIPSVPWFEL